MVLSQEIRPNQPRLMSDLQPRECTLHDNLCLSTLQRGGAAAAAAGAAGAVCSEFWQPGEAFKEAALAIATHVCVPLHPDPHLVYYVEPCRTTPDEATAAIREGSQLRITSSSSGFWLPRRGFKTSGGNAKPIACSPLCCACSAVLVHPSVGLIRYASLTFHG